MIKSKKEYGMKMLKQIFIALHEKNFGDIMMIVDESSLDTNELKEFVQGTVELNDFDAIDEYREENIILIDDESDEPFTIESYLSADDGHELPLCLILELRILDNGNMKSTLNIEPN